MKVAIIPARGGSKRIPNKNIRLFAGRPMISHSIRAAQESRLFDRILVTTDSDEIAKVASDHGAEVPFKRPPELSDDKAPTAPVIAHALEWLIDQHTPVTYACCIYATAPFLRPDDLRRGFEILKQSGASTALTVTTFAFPIFRALKLADDGTVSMFWPQHMLTRSQDLAEAYHDAGQFYWMEAARFLQHRSLYQSDTRAIVLPRCLVQDIDTLEDWETAECMNEGLMLRSAREMK